MERYDRDRYYRGGNNDDRYDYDNNNRNRYDRYDRFDSDDRAGHELKLQFERDYRNSDYRNNNSRYNQDDSYNQGYQRSGDRGDRYGNSRSRFDDRDTSYAADFRGNENNQGNIRQGYGISSFDGTSDRYNTLNSNQRDNNMQEEQPYYSGNRDHLRSTRYGGGVGDAFPNSNRGVPNYATRTFADDYGTGMGSTYGGKNYGAGTGYESGNKGGSFGNNMYGNSSGNYGGYGSMGGSTYGAGQSSSGGGSSHNSDRRTSGNYGY